MAKGETGRGRRGSVKGRGRAEMCGRHKWFERAGPPHRRYFDASPRRGGAQLPAFEGGIVGIWHGAAVCCGTTTEATEATESGICWDQVAARMPSVKSSCVKKDAGDRRRGSPRRAERRLSPECHACQREVGLDWLWFSEKPVHCVYKLADRPTVLNSVLTDRGELERDRGESKVNSPRLKCRQGV
jgi:hypothetical protein